MSETETKVQRLLSGHGSPETAYTVDDYPYGYRLRCKIRYWLEYKDGYGARLASQTTNPKKAGIVWNKPKYSTYARFGACMYLDEQGHVQWAGLNEYSNGQEAAEWRAKYGAGVPDTMRHTMNVWVETKLEYDRQKANGAAWNDPKMAAHCRKIGLERAEELREEGETCK